MTSPSDPCEEPDSLNIFNRARGIVEVEMNWDDVDTAPLDSSQCCQVNYYFKVTSVVGSSDSNVADNSQVRCCKILADNRMTLEGLKKNLEGIVRVPSEYFKIFRQYPNSDEEWSCLTDTISDASIKDGER